MKPSDQTRPMEARLRTNRRGAEACLRTKRGVAHPAEKTHKSSSSDERALLIDLILLLDRPLID